MGLALPLVDKFSTVYFKKKRWIAATAADSAVATIESVIYIEKKSKVPKKFFTMIWTKIFPSGTRSITKWNSKGI